MDATAAVAAKVTVFVILAAAAASDGSRETGEDDRGGGGGGDGDGGGLPTGCGLQAVTLSYQHPGRTTAAAHAAGGSGYGSNVTLVRVNMCMGVCPPVVGAASEARLWCHPSRTRAKRVPLGHEQRNTKEVEKAGVSIDDDDDGLRGTPAIDVLEHLDCQCTSVQHEKESRYKPSLASSWPQAAPLFAASKPPLSSSPPSKASSLSSSSSQPSFAPQTRLENLRPPPTTWSPPPPPPTPGKESANYYQTCLACKEQSNICEAKGQVYDHDLCHCVYPSSRTFLNSFYTLGVVMLTVMVCCFLVFGVQKGDENVLNSARRSTRRRHSCHHRRSCSFQRRFSFTFRDTAANPRPGAAVAATSTLDIEESEGRREQTSVANSVNATERITKAE